MASKTPRISTFMIAMIWVSFAAVIYGGFISGLTVNYNVGYNESNTEVFNKLATLDATARSIKNDTNIKEESSALDVIGGYFSSAYKVLKSTATSFDVFNDMADEALKNENLNIVAGESLKIAIISTVIILIFVGIVLSAIVKRDL